jgi:hypothetical protein
MNFIHELADQVNAPSVVGIQILTPLWIGLKFRAEPWSRIGHDNYDSALRIRLQPAPDLF